RGLALVTLAVAGALAAAGAGRLPGGKPTPRRETQILGLTSFTPKTGDFTVFDKFRGPGDCGIYSAFALHGNALEPVEARAKVACDGKGPYDPARWPKLPLPS